MGKKIVCALLMNMIGLMSVASAHYLWVSVDPKVGEYGTTNIYFEEGPAPGDGQYLDPFVKAGKTWIRTVNDVKPKLLPIKEATAPKQRWLSAPLPNAAPRSIDSYGMYGVYTYGKTEVLLHYYARLLEVDSHDDMHELARAEQMDLDIVPHDHGDEIELTVLWKGQPVAKRPVYLRGPKNFRQTVETDENGEVRFKAEAPGQYLLRTFVEENKQGMDGDRKYDLIRHNGTLALRLPLKK